MPDNNGSPLGRFADAVRKQLHEHEGIMHKQDIRLNTLETTNKVLKAALGFIVLMASLAVSIIALHNRQLQKEIKTQKDAYHRQEGGNTKEAGIGVRTLQLHASSGSEYAWDQSCVLFQNQGQVPVEEHPGGSVE